MPEVTVPAAPAMGRVSNVELMHTGTWDLSTGTATFTVDDFAAAVGALDCPAVRRPILKLGHTPDPAPGQPAVGFIANMATAEDGRTLVGDYVGLPGWLVDENDHGVSVLAASYPDRSVEGQWNFRCQIGHTHPFVITAVALLGEERPAIGTIQSLQDLADLYGVAAAAGEEGSGEPITITVSKEGGVMPNPRPAPIAASVTTEDVRRAFYASPIGEGWSMWIEEIQLDPLQLIVLDDDKAVRSRVPVTVADGDGTDAVSFGDPVPVVVRYDDAVAAAAPQPVGKAIRFASRKESRPAPTPAQAMAEVHAAAAKKKPPVAVAAGAGTTATKGAGMDPAKLREGLGLAPDASDEDVNAAMQAALSSTPTPAADATPTPPAPAAEPVAAAAQTPRVAGTMVIDASAWDAQQERIKRLEAQEAKRGREERDTVIAAAVKDGKFAPARAEHWARLWDADAEGTRQVIAGLQKNVIPVEALGHADLDGEDLDAEYAGLFPPAAGNKKRGA
jgi:hypothetical protein